MQNNLSREEVRRERAKLRRDLLGKKELLRRQEVKLEEIEFEEQQIKIAKARLRSNIDEDNDKIKNINGELRRLDETIENNKRIKSRTLEEIKLKELDDVEKDNESREIGVKRTKVEYEIEKARTEIRKIDNEIKMLR